MKNKLNILRISYTIVLITFIYLYLVSIQKGLVGTYTLLILELAVLPTIMMQGWFIKNIKAIFLSTISLLVCSSYIIEYKGISNDIYTYLITMCACVVCISQFYIITDSINRLKELNTEEDIMKVVTGYDLFSLMLHFNYIMITCVSTVIGISNNKGNMYYAVFLILSSLLPLILSIGVAIWSKRFYRIKVKELVAEQ